MSDHDDVYGEPRPDMLTFLASSVHDMKNSVSMLIGGMQKILAASDPKSFPDYDDLTQMTYEARRINANLVQLLTLYKLGEHLYPFDPQEIAAHGFLTHVADQAGVLLRARTVSLDVDAPADLYWYFDEDLVGNVIGNAFSNAVRYTRDRVRLSARVDDGMLEIRIEDNGTLPKGTATLGRVKRSLVRLTLTWAASPALTISPGTMAKVLPRLLAGTSRRSRAASCTSNMHWWFLRGRSIGWTLLIRRNGHHAA